MTHLLIIWNRAYSYKDWILSQIKDSFHIVAITSVLWDEDLFADNLKIFYSRSWQKHPSAQIENALKYKKEYCGTGPFLAIVFNDSNPFMDWRETSNGKQWVNAHVFDKKEEYRKITGGGHLIHASNNAEETNRDLTLLFGQNSRDFLKANTNSTNRDNIWRKNCVGVGGYTSITQFFYVLNNSINYCVLRNHDCLPYKYTKENHGDIDLLVENKRQMACLTLAHSVYSEPYRVYHTIRIAGEEVPFDFRYVEDNYFDILWEQHILEHRQLSRGLFYIPSAEDQYYSLLYHVYIQKHEVKPDYLPILTSYGKIIEKHFEPEAEQAIHQLDVFLCQHNYEYIIPKDKTVVYNKYNLRFSSYALRYGQCIKRSEEKGDNGYKYTSRIYEKENSYIKLGTTWLIENEQRFLNKLSGNRFFPEIISYKHIESDLTLMEISKTEGCSFSMFFGNMNYQHSRFVRSFIKQIIRVLRIFNQKGIYHRDLTPSNILISLNNKQLIIGVIDFGWAADSNDKQSKTPSHLGGRFALNGAPSDYYAVATILMDYWPDVPYIRLISSFLFKATKESPKKQLRIIERMLWLPFTPYDEFRLLLRRHQRISQIWHRIKK